MTGRFDDKCPYCMASLDTYSAFQGADYATEFYVECFACGRKIVVDVTMEPVFELNKEETVSDRDRWAYGLPRVQK